MTLFFIFVNILKKIKINYILSQYYNQLKTKILFKDTYSIDDLLPQYYDQYLHIYIEETLIDAQTNDIYVFPKNEQSITFGKNFQEDIENDLPETVKKLTFYGIFKASKNTKIPVNVTTLIFYGIFGYDGHFGFVIGFKPGVNFIPPTVKHIKFYSAALTIPVGLIPEGVTHLTCRIFYIDC